MSTRYGLPVRTSPESLGMRYDHVIPYGPEEVIVAGCYWMGYGKPGYYAAIYTYLDEKEMHEPEDDMEVAMISGIEFDDIGHAVEWGISQVKNMY